MAVERATSITPGLCPLPPELIYEDKYKNIFQGDTSSRFDGITIRANFVRADWLTDNEDVFRKAHEAPPRVHNWMYDEIDKAIDMWADLVDEDQGVLEYPSGMPKCIPEG